MSRVWICCGESYVTNVREWVSEWVCLVGVTKWFYSFYSSPVATLFGVLNSNFSAWKREKGNEHTHTACYLSHWLTHFHTFGFCSTGDHEREDHWKFWLALSSVSAWYIRPIRTTHFTSVTKADFCVMEGALKTSFSMAIIACHR